MIIIFEGADGAGKSTAAELLYDIIVSEVKPFITPALLHRGPPKRDPLIEYTLDLEDGGDPNRWFICDRWHWGELIYGPIYRGKSILTGAGHRAVDEFLARRNALLIHLDTETEIILSRVEERGDDYVNPVDLPTIVRQYRELREVDTPLQRRTIRDFSGDDARQIIRDFGWSTRKEL